MKSHAPTSAEIAPCPFCGSANIFTEPDEHGSGGQWVAPIHVGCVECKAEQIGEDADEAIAAWNRRAAMQPAEPARYPHPKCDSGCYYNCTKGGQQAPDCVAPDRAPSIAPAAPGSAPPRPAGENESNQQVSACNGPNDQQLSTTLTPGRLSAPSIAPQPWQDRMPCPPGSYASRVPYMQAEIDEWRKLACVEYTKWKTPC